ncbi:Hypothetical protein R9X50_00015100 [Acrodontium crateriforme]|uniref:Ubiquitin carboxyl-terminal hydrolase n=1 Tax=Acrodontium crateriforme TaxID=150365 RepID=A0AAQ3M2S3_9PEZI|nr:Hypothetical protein R9X50_00015100 [Acrodontium crateriforme]
MPPKRGRKRKVDAVVQTNGITLPDRKTWPGWVEMESEPAFFNVMLSEMGVKGAKVQEVYSLDDEMLAILPQPVYALIFLFRYRDIDKQDQETGTCPKDVWFANQVPDFACATFALLNIINNIPGLDMGHELRTFKEFTKDMDPLDRGNAVDHFDFVRKIHNSFARENDLLQADQYAKSKAAKAKKRQALAKARETRAANKAAKTTTPKNEKPSVQTTRSSGRAKKPSNKSEALNTTSETVHENNNPIEPKKPNDELKINHRDPTSNSPSDNETHSDEDFKTAKTTPTTQPNPLRRSTRAPKPRHQHPQTQTLYDNDDNNEDDGFHFIAYMPIGHHVWKLDGLNRHPQSIGTQSDLDNWISIVQPALQTRMAQYEGREIEFNLMAVVHDSLATDQAALARNAKTIRVCDEWLDIIHEGWRDVEGAETGADVVVYESEELGVTAAEIEGAETLAETICGLEEAEDLVGLIQRRRNVVLDQGDLRARVRDALESSRLDEDKARHRRHDYRTFLRSWLGALAEQGVLSDLIDG